MWWSAIDTESVSDSGSSITVLVVALSLVALGVALLGVTVWFWRFTRPDPEALGPLVVMSEPGFFGRGPIEQRRSLDVARPRTVVIEPPRDVVDEPVESPDDEWVDESDVAPIEWDAGTSIESDDEDPTSVSDDESPGTAAGESRIDPLL